MEFEGSAVTETEGRLPAVKVLTPEAYKRGTILKLSMEVRVKSVRLEENKDGDLTRSHVFVVETINVDEAYDPSQVAAQMVSSGPADVLLEEEHLPTDSEVFRDHPSSGVEYLEIPPGTIPDYPARPDLTVVPETTDDRLESLEEANF